MDDMLTVLQAIVLALPVIFCYSADDTECSLQLTDDGVLVFFQLVDDDRPLEPHCRVGDPAALGTDDPPGISNVDGAVQVEMLVGHCCEVMDVAGIGLYGNWRSHALQRWASGMGWKWKE